ncbi:TetR family transcriptional regulator [Mycolicibacterium sp.]|uniref:TetR/AcrR family transcriptional regulator n=1 Tax=Mycolicibacterium sp. TaxID=2320850 RepID=UPI00093AE933|nr:TetR family transcriptional regulator [Mycobacterium sp. SWH-M3]
MRRTAAEAKAGILAAARERFAADGYERATIRAIAGDAAIDPAMVMRYFGSKEGLFAAAAEFDLDLPDLTEIAAERLGAALAAHFVERWERDEALQILLRVGVTNEAVAERIRTIFAAQLAPVIVKATANPQEAPVRASLVASQVLGMALCRYVLAFPPLAGMSREDVVAWIGPTLQRYLTASEPRDDSGE